MNYERMLTEPPPSQEIEYHQSPKPTGVCPPFITDTRVLPRGNYREVSPVFELDINKTIQYKLLCLASSFTVKFLRFVYVLVCGCNVFTSKVVWDIPYTLRYSLLMTSQFLVLPIMNSAVRDTYPGCLLHMCVILGVYSHEWNYRVESPCSK